MKTVYSITNSNDTESIRNQRTVNKSYTGFYLFIGGLVSVAVWSVNIILSHI